MIVASEKNEDGKSYKNVPNTNRSQAYEAFVGPINNDRRGGKISSNKSAIRFLLYQDISTGGVGLRSWEPLSNLTIKSSFNIHQFVLR